MSALPAMPDEAARLVTRYYTFAGVYTLAASIIWGINTLFLLSSGLSISEAFIANAAFSVGTMLFEIPTGVIADTIGRRASFLLSLVVLAASTVIYVGLAALEAGVIAFSAASVFIGLGFTFYSGATEAWLVDGVRALGYEGEMDGIFARSQIIGGIAIGIGTIGGGLLGQINLSIPYLVRAGLLAALFVLAFNGMHDIGFKPRALRMRDVGPAARKVTADGVKFGWNSKPLRLLMIAGAVQSGFFFWAWYAWQPYVLDLLERDAVWVAGVVAAVLALAMIIGNSLVSTFTRFCGRRTTILLWATGIFAIGSIAVGFANGFILAVVLLFISDIGVGLYMPVRQAFVHEFAPSAERATVVSFDSMVGGVGAFGSQAGLGVLADRHGYAVGYLVGGSVALAATPLFWVLRRMRSEADFFTGSHRADIEGCTPAGLPAIAQVGSPEVLD